ncbi:unnamed protein product [Anisakis simplex]|uniref:Ankyrin repeat protein n=1 Tax=Anisakis simplex TaxID=6269 RepID=A0A0M3JTS9_ANISI|nr:unnamed protein product [Anisakis simplex]
MGGCCSGKIFEWRWYRSINWRRQCSKNCHQVSFFSIVVVNILKRMSEVLIVGMIWDPFSMDDMLLARLRSMRSKVEPCPVLKSFSKDHHLFATDAVTTAVINIINAQDVEHSWRELVESLKASDESGIQIVTSQLLHTMFAPWRQQALLNGICNHMDSRGDGKTVLSVLVQQRLFTATEVCSRIVELAQRKNWSDIIIHLVRYSLSIDESVYARCLRTAADNLLIIELLMILVDGCANKMIWDAKCHEIVRRAANFISEQVQLTDAISSITYQLGNDLSKIIRDDSMRYPDYVIESVPYQCKSL